MSAETVAFIWAVLIAFAVLAYVILDGFDLGVGLLFAVERGPEDRDVMVNSVAPVWDGNETWLCWAGGGLLAVFPLAYAIILPALYPVHHRHAARSGVPRRGVRVPLPRRDGPGQETVGPVVLRRLGGCRLVPGPGARRFLQGIKVENRHYAGGWFDWLTPFTVLCGVAVLCGYAWLGACWLVWRTEGSLQVRARKQAVFLGVMMAGFVAVVSLWTPFLNATFMHRWFSWPGILLTSPVPVLVALVSLYFWYGIKKEHHVTPFLCALMIFTLCFAGLGVSVFPLMVPPSITIWEAAAPRNSQVFLLIGAAVLIPAILAYSAFSYWVFRGKVVAGAHYH